MLSQQQVDNLLFSNHKYFDCEENCSQYSQAELENILIHLENLSEKYFNRIIELHNDPYERSDKNTARNVMNNAYNQVYNYYLTKTTITTKINKPCSYNKYYVICAGIILSILLYFII
jgi:hypothetical protein